MVHAHTRILNLRRLKNCGLSPKTLTQLRVGLYHRLVRQLHHPQAQGSPEGVAVCPMHHWGQTTCPPGHLQHQMSQEGQKDHQGQQPPEPLPVHPVSIQKARSVEVHQSWTKEIESVFQSQGHQIVKQPPVAQRGCCLPTDLISLDTLINGTLVTLIIPL